MALEIPLGENSTITRLAAPVALHAAQLLQPPFDASLPQRILDDGTQGLALGLSERLGIASELCGKGDRFLDCGSHGWTLPTISLLVQARTTFRRASRRRIFLRKALASDAERPRSYSPALPGAAPAPPTDRRSSCASRASLRAHRRTTGRDRARLRAAPAATPLTRGKSARARP